MGCNESSPRHNKNNDDAVTTDIAPVPADEVLRYGAPRHHIPPKQNKQHHHRHGANEKKKDEESSLPVVAVLPADKVPSGAKVVPIGRGKNDKDNNNEHKKENEHNKDQSVGWSELDLANIGSQEQRQN